MSKRISIDEMATKTVAFVSKNQQFVDHIKGLSEDDLISLQHNLGTDIRNHFDLWSVDWEPELVDGADVSPNHPDNISMQVIKLVWKLLQQ